jgi:tetratricopeptide (TPR) repeat protein
MKKQYRPGAAGNRKIWLVLPVVALIGALIGAGIVFFPEKFSPLISGAKRVAGSFSFLFLGEPPHFYYLDMEKNGQEAILRPGDSLEISYKDEFVIKGVSSDAFFGRGIAVDVEGMGTGNDYGVLLRGMELIDHIVQKEKDVSGKVGAEKYRIVVIYRGKEIAALPLNVNVLPQDWLRYARSTDNRKLQIEYLKRAIAMNDKDANVVKMLAGVYARAGLPEDAIVQYRRALEIAPNDLNALMELSKCYMTTKDYQQVVETGRQILRFSPRDAATFMDIALAYSGLGQWEKAIANYKESLQLNPDNPLGRFKLGEAYEKTDRLAAAIEQYKVVLAKAPTAHHAMAALAGAALRTGNYDEAIKWYTQAVGKQPRNAAMWANLGLAYGGKGLWKEEVENYRKSLTLAPNDPVVHFNLATAYEKGKKEPEAAAEYQKVLILKPDDLDTLQRLADMDLRAKRFAQAIRRYERMVKIAPKRAAGYANLGFAYGELNKHQQAVENYEKAIKNGAKEPQLLYNLAYSNEQLGRTKEAIRGYEKYAALHPTAPVLNILAEYYLKEKQYDSALKQYKKITELDPKNAAAYAGSAYVYALKGDVVKEIEYYKLAVRYDPEDDASHLNLGGAYESREMYADAYRSYVKAYELNPEATKARTKIPQMRIRMLEKKYKE